ncbi:MAG: hypothetical protein ACE5D0_04380 [Fidelibacterota bacterium]
MNKKKIFTLGGTRFTIRTAGVFFLISAVVEGLSLSSAVPLFGDLRGGVIAVIYHLLFVGLFLGMGIGLWAAKSWGFRYMFYGTIFYTLERILYILDGSAREMEAATTLGRYQSLLGQDGQSLVSQAMNLTTILTILCWWGFVLYLYFKREYFGSSTK